jgi:hypothetical protein
VPSPDVLLTELGSIANNWRWLAIGWHLIFAGLFFALFVGWRPRARLLGLVLVAPLVSVSVVAWLSGNPFNGTMFAVLAAFLIWSAAQLGQMPVIFARVAWVAAGAGVILFGWIYPHFVRMESRVTYLYASPFGVLPCPTLAVVIGITLIFWDLGSRRWHTALFVAGLLYGAIGVFGLRVQLDWVLLLASVLLGAAMACDPTPLDRTTRGTRHARIWTRAALM